MDGLLEVSFVEFATLPDIDGETARMMLLIDEPGTERLFVSDMRGPLYTVTYDGRTVTQYLDVNADRWGVGVESPRRGLGVQSFAFHPQFTQPGTPGFGKLYTWTDTSNTAPDPDFAPGGGDNTHDIVLLEWTAGAPGATTYDGGPPRELLRIEEPFRNHNGGHIDFNPLAAPSDPDFGLLYMGMADGGSGGDPLNNARTLARRLARSCVSTHSGLTASTATTEFLTTTRSPTTATPPRWAKSTPTVSVTLTVSGGIQEQQPVRRRHRTEPRRGAESGDGRRQPWLERLGGGLTIYQSRGKSATAP